MKYTAECKTSPEKPIPCEYIAWGQTFRGDLMLKVVNYVNNIFYCHSWNTLNGSLAYPFSIAHSFSEPSMAHSIAHKILKFARLSRGLSWFVRLFHAQSPSWTLKTLAKVHLILFFSFSLYCQRIRQLFDWFVRVCCALALSDGIKYSIYQFRMAFNPV